MLDVVYAGVSMLGVVCPCLVWCVHAWCFVYMLGVMYAGVSMLGVVCPCAQDHH